jgi:hypothetical protein
VTGPRPTTLAAAAAVVLLALGACLLLWEEPRDPARATAEPPNAPGKGPPMVGAGTVAAPESAGAKPLGKVGPGAAEPAREVDAAPSLAGRVLLLPGRAPVEGATVALRLLDPAPRVLRGRTDAGGRFSLGEGVPPVPGEATLQVEAPGAALHVGIVAIPAGGGGDLEILLDSGITLAGTVTDPEGRPLAGALVANAGELDRDDSLQRHGAAGILGFIAGAEVPDDLSDRIARTDAEGRFDLRFLPAGALRLCAAAPGFVPAYHVLDPAAAAPEGGPVLVLERRGRILGKARPAKGGHDQVLWKPESMSVATAPVGKDGTFEIPDLLPGLYGLQVGGGDLLVAVGAGQTVRVDFTEPRGATLRCRIVGEPDPARLVALMGLQTLDPADPIRSRTAFVTRERDFRFEGLPPGRYELTALRGTVVQVVEIPPGVAEVVVELADGGTKSLGGRVTDGKGVPVAGAVVRAFPEAMVRSWPEDMASAAGEHWVGARTARTGADGAFELRGLPAALHVLSVGAPGFGFANAGSFEPGRDGPVTVVLEPGTGVTVRLLGPDGRPVRLGALGVFDGRGILVAEDVGEGTRLRGWGIAPGEYEILAATPEGPFARLAGTVVGRENRVLEMRLGTGGDAVVRVLRSGKGGGIAGSSVAISLPDGRGLPRLGGAGVAGSGRFRRQVLAVAADGDGIARRRGLSAGEYLATVTTPDGLRGSARFRIEDGKATEVSVPVP